MSEPYLVIALLAAGASHRFGTSNKLLAIWHGKPLIIHAAQTLRRIPAYRHIAICPPDDIALHDTLMSAGFEICINTKAHEGQSASVRMAAQLAIECSADALLIALGDMPNVPSAHYTALINGITEGQIMASRKSGGGANMPPAYFGKDAILNLLEARGDKGARDIIATATPIITAADILRDFDTAADFEG